MPNWWNIFGGGWDAFGTQNNKLGGGFGYNNQAPNGNWYDEFTSPEGGYIEGNNDMFAGNKRQLFGKPTGNMIRGGDDDIWEDWEEDIDPEVPGYDTDAWEDWEEDVDPDIEEWDPPVDWVLEDIEEEYDLGDDDDFGDFELDEFIFDEDVPYTGPWTGERQVGTDTIAHALNSRLENILGSWGW